MPGPRIFQYCRANSRGQVESVFGGLAVVEGGEDAERLGVALEPVCEPQPATGNPVEHFLAEVPERWVPEAVCCGRCLRHDVVASAEFGNRGPCLFVAAVPKADRDRTGNSRHLEWVGEAVVDHSAGTEIGRAHA